MKNALSRVAVAALPFVVAAFATQGALAARRPADVYDYQEDAEGMTKCVRLAIPNGMAVVRGILVNSNGAGGDTRDAYRQAWHEEFLDLHGFAFIGAKAFTSHKESFDVLIHALQRFAQESRHPELVHAPLVTVGFSAGGGFASRLVIEAPERIIAAVPCSTFLRAEPTPVVLGVPICLISGELEPRITEVTAPVVSAYRPKGGLLSWMTVQGLAHQWAGQYTLALPLLDAAVRLRYPADQDPRNGPVRLAAIPASRGWIADNTSWKDGLTRIYPAGKFKGDIAKSSWLPSDDLAFIYRAYATYDNSLRITSPASILQSGQVLEAGANVTIAVDAAQFPKWKRLEFFDGARSLGEVSKVPTQLTARGLAPGFHVFSVLGVDAKRQTRSSGPVLIVVRKPAGAGR